MPSCEGNYKSARIAETGISAIHGPQLKCKEQRIRRLQGRIDEQQEHLLKAVNELDRVKEANRQLSLRLREEKRLNEVLQGQLDQAAGTQTTRTLFEELQSVDQEFRELVPANVGVQCVLGEVKREREPCCGVF